MTTKDPNNEESRPFLGVRFDCCNAYVRIHRNKDGTAYEGHCPKCLRPLTIPFGAGGSSNRFFTAA